MKIWKKLISFLLAALFIVGTIPTTALAVIADEIHTQSSTSTSTSTSVTESADSSAPTTEETPTSPYVKNRSAITQDPETGLSFYGVEAAVYVDGEVVFRGSFEDAWKETCKRAPSTKDKSSEQIKKLREVEFVLNEDWIAGRFGGDNDYYYYGALRTGDYKKLTIDLNGHMLCRTNRDSVLYSGSVIDVEERCRITILDSNPNIEHKGTLHGGRWEYDGKGNTVIKGGVITGGHWRNESGGGIAIECSSTVYIRGGTIAGNEAKWGGGIALDDNNSTVDMTGGTAKVCYNVSSGTLDGGAGIVICWDADNCSVYGGTVCDNKASEYGGGIYARGNNAKIIGVTVENNWAGDDGGGIYVESDGILVKDCKIKDNYAKHSGGGMFLYEDPVTIDSCEISNNRSGNHGAGVHNTSWCDTTLQGVTVIKNNKKTDGTNSNFFIRGNSDLIAGDLKYGSEIWVRTRKAAKDYNGVSNPITDYQTGASALFFHADESGYYVKYQDDPAKKNYRHLYLVEGTRTELDVQNLTEYTPKVINTIYTVGEERKKEEEEANAKAGIEAPAKSYPTDGNKFPITRGVFEYNLMTTSTFYSASPFYYSDGYFFEDPEYYNPHLATMSINLAVAAFGRSTSHIANNAYANHFANVKQLMADIGCKDEHFFANEDYQNKPQYFGEEDRLSTIGVAISQKKITCDDESYTLIPIAIRGGSYEVEWASNVTLGTSGEAKGFSDAATQVYGHVQNYIKNYDLEESVAAGRVKFWVVGYSRAGATANLTSKRLVDTYGLNGNQVFGYTFEAPMGGIPVPAEDQNENNDNGKYLTIHNTINENDFVTLVAPSQMGFMRYGVDHLRGTDFNNNQKVSYNTNSQYYKQRMKMIAQLNAINPYYKFNDDWEPGDIDPVLGSLFGWLGEEIIDPGNDLLDNPNEEAKNMYEYLRWFFERVQKDGLNTDSSSKFREYYAGKAFINDLNKNDKIYSSLSVEQAAVVLMQIVQTFTDEEMTAVTEFLMGNVMYNINKQSDIDWSFNPFSTVLELISYGYWSYLPMIIDYFLDYLQFWDYTSAQTNGEQMKTLLDLLYTGKNTNKYGIIKDQEHAEIWRKAVDEAIPTLLWFVLNYASEDYDKSTEDSGMWGVGSFIVNMNLITSNHYQEVSVAWVRSYDSYYNNDLQAYRIQKTNTTTPTHSINKEGELVFTAEAGSSIFYSTDNGTSWNLYTTPVKFESVPKNVKAFSISRGVKSTELSIPESELSGSIIGDGYVWFIAIGSVAMVAATAAAVVFIRRKRRIEK